ncbi:fimbrial protein [Enterobacteriaceae bacterium RIT714]|nr:fimbrial protein [Enterobacteriaceae bacterium RIT714]
MKNQLKVILLFSSTMFGSSVVFAEDGQINFTGEILDAACTVDIGAGNTMTVDLGKVNKSIFDKTGATSAPTAFVLTLKDCPAAITSAAIKFDGTSLDGDNNILALTAGTTEAPAAAGIGIQILDDDNSVVALATASKDYDLEADTANKLNFSARYIANSDTVVAGPADSAVSFTVNYN